MKRVFDFLASLAALFLLSPIIIVTAIFIKISSPGPILFVQHRAGKYGESFPIYKFRSMTHDVNRVESGIKIGDARITKIGHFIREWSIDELPQLFNVLLGHMSLVGPRPLLLQYYDRYTPTQRERLDVKPGITGFQQVKGRYQVTWERKFAYDVHYVRNRSLCFDLKIMLLTVKIILFRPEAAKSGGATYEFMG